MELISKNILYKIFNNLDIIRLIYISRTCKKYYNIIFSKNYLEYRFNTLYKIRYKNILDNNNINEKINYIKLYIFLDENKNLPYVYYTIYLNYLIKKKIINKDYKNNFVINKDINYSKTKNYININIIKSFLFKINF